MSLEEYEILGIVGDSINSSSYKVQNKLTKAVFTWYAIDYTNIKSDEKQNLLKRLHERKSVVHPHFLKFHNYIEHDQSKILYVSTNYCQNGSLKSLIEKCDKNQQCLSEEFIFRILYQICFTFKTSRTRIYSLKPQDIFLDEDYKVKIFNFDFQKHSSDSSELKMKELVKLTSQLCILKIDDNAIDDCISLTKYSKDFSVLIRDLLEDITMPISKTVDKILCHPVVLLKSSQWTKEKSFLYKQPEDQIAPLEMNIKSISTENIQEASHKFRKWEQNLKMKEKELKEKEHTLATREKRLFVQERFIKEKLIQADLYLKRCRETKSVSSGSSKSSHKSKKVNYDNLDSTYAECGDSMIVSTSEKLNVEKLRKSGTFTRTLSENKKVRFKGHSPLKEIDYNKRRMKPVLKKIPLFQDGSENSVDTKLSHDKLLKPNSANTTVNLNPNSKKLARNSKLFLVDENVPPPPPPPKFRDSDCRPISWTEESKRHAFDLLRVMNNAIDIHHSGDIKHTYL